MTAFLASGYTNSRRAAVVYDSGTSTRRVESIAGQIQTGLDPKQLLPSRDELIRQRVEFQRRLLQARQRRMTPIKVTREGVIWDGHHAVRAAAELGLPVDVLVVAQAVPPSGLSIMQLPVR